ncbi:MAG TPA: EAL domain-containing response regulator [Xanthobacteraceae bacterium]|nr:EAL domain-containing response regulator [Xanthobacteraceae bacterium]
MSDTNKAIELNAPAAVAVNSLCFIIDKDFIFRQGLAAELRRTGIDVVELSAVGRLLEMVENQNPDIILVNVDRPAPHESIRALLVLKDCGYKGVVQLFGNGDLASLDSLNLVGADCALTMLEPLQKPIKAATLHRIIRERKLGSPVPPSAGITLAEALARDLVTFLYQPKFDLKANNLVVGAEATARVNHPRLGLLTPDCFLKGADQDDLLKLANVALVNAARSSLHFQELGLAMEISINISAENLLSLPVIDIVSRYRPDSDNWGGVLLEITSRQLANKSDALKSLGAKLAEAGVPIAIDNFGIGPVHFDVLNRLKFREIKIDRSLIEGCANDGAKRRICKSIIQIAHNFGAQAVAVGVSNEADFEVLTRLECDLAQGFLFGKPMSVQQIDSLIAKSKLGPKSAA